MGTTFLIFRRATLTGDEVVKKIKESPIQRSVTKATLRYFYEQIVAGGTPICEIKILVAKKRSIYE